jgi:hypothetical protein
MPTKKKPLRELPKIPKELLEQFSANPLMTAEAIEEASAAFKKALIERALNADLAIIWAILRARRAQRMRPISATARAARPY